MTHPQATAQSEPAVCDHGIRSPWACDDCDARHDTRSVAYRHGYSQGVEGREFRNPCEGNPLATQDHYFGFIKGQADRTGVGHTWGRTS